MLRYFFASSWWGLLAFEAPRLAGLASGSSERLGLGMGGCSGCWLPLLLHLFSCLRPSCLSGRCSSWTHPPGAIALSLSEQAACSSQTWASTHSSAPSAPSRDSPATWSTVACSWSVNPNYWAPVHSASADAASARRSSCFDQWRRLATSTPVSCSHHRRSALASATELILLAASSILWPRCCGMAAAFDIDFETAEDVEGGPASSARSSL